MTDCDGLWVIERVSEPLIPEHPKRHQGGGRPRIDDRTALAAILYVLRSGCAWDALPASFGISTPSAHRRFTEWVEHGVFDALHRAVLDIRNPRLALSRRPLPRIQPGEHREPTQHAVRGRIVPTTFRNRACCRSQPVNIASNNAGARSKWTTFGAKTSRAAPTAPITIPR